MDRDSGTASDASARQSAADFLGPSGPLARSLRGWEDRLGQRQMAEAVETAIQDRRHLVVEAGTGTGKTLAYLVPLVLTGMRAVISTATKNLQEQLVRKDVPLLERVLGRTLRVAVMKGRNNYLCLQKLADLGSGSQPVLKGMSEVNQLSLIREWADTTETGDRAELQGLPENSRLWPTLDARRDTCSGRKCSLFEQCFITRMHKRAREADLIVVNHYLFFADLALRRDDFGSILPGYQAVVFDEAHQIEGIVGRYFGVYFSTPLVDRLARDVQGTAKKAGFSSKALDRRVRQLRGAAAGFFALFADSKPRERLTERVAFRRKNGACYQGLLAALVTLEAQLALAKDHSDETNPLRERSRLLRLTLRTLFVDLDSGALNEAYEHPTLTHVIEDRGGEYVYWLERRRKTVVLQATPIEVASILGEALFDERGGTAVLASATLAVEGGFEFIRGRLGLAAADELVVPGHFDYRRQALLYLPRNMPPPNSREYAGRATTEILKLLDLSRGRAFVLCTSYANMSELHKRVSMVTGFPCLVQGEGSHASVLERFRKTRNCVLFATASFWQGVDVPGRQLSCVIVDKLPFMVPSDPVVRARIERIQRQGGNAFSEYQVPAAALALKQGFGRLLRSASDRGVLALLDQRVVTKGYGSAFLRSLPEYATTTNLGEVAAFFRAGGR